MEKNIILAGVGGQGILSIAYVIDNAALDAGYNFKQAEVHGMAQRGGAVQSHLRFADGPIHSDLIPAGSVDMILSVEPLEVLRYWHLLQPEGWIVTSTTPYVNIPDYPEMDDLLEKLAGFGRVVLVDSGRLAKAAGNLRAQNMVLVGAAAPLLGFGEEQLLTHVERLFATKGEKIVGVNRRAFQLGHAVGRFFRGLVDGGVTPRDALHICGSLDPSSIEPDQAATWAKAVAESPGRLDELLAEAAAPARS